MFVERLKELIDDSCNGSQKVFAIKTQIPTSTVNQWIIKGTRPTYTQIIKICDCFGISADYLLGRENYVTGNVEIVGVQLTSDEQQLINLYRTLPTRDRAELVGFAKGLAY